MSLISSNGDSTTLYSSTELSERMKASGKKEGIIKDPSSLLSVVYVGCRTTKERNARGEGINVFQVNHKSGNWEQIQLVKDIINPSFLTFDRNKNFLYTVHGDCSEVSAFKIDKRTGKLTFINKQSTGGRNPVHLVVDATNQYIVVSNYISGTLSVLPINVDGSLKELCNLKELPERTEDPNVNLYAKQGIPHPHHNPLDPTGRFFIVPDLGLNRLYIYTLDSGQGKLVVNNPPYVDTGKGSGPRHVDFHPSLPYLYLANELDSTVATYYFNVQEGSLVHLQTLSTLPECVINNTCAEVFTSPSGKFVYVSNRGHNSIAIFKVDQSNGLLSPVGWEPTLGETPRFFTFDSSGQFLFVANEDSDTIVSFKLNDEDGKLMFTGQVVQTGSPVCILPSLVDS
ncbi:lactonase family protein [Priestia filamentosa]|uniref:lactonase family protein n=1 Tax=Priestia filamentosa TaxID=1402861 RepID=UPI0003068B8B|nr:lactonase family protein [Priestia filamentosa]